VKEIFKILSFVLIHGAYVAPRGPFDGIFERFQRFWVEGEPIMKLLQALRASALIASSLVLAQVSIDAQIDRNNDEPVVPLSIRNPDVVAASSYSNLRVHVFYRHKVNAKAQQAPQLSLRESGNSLSDTANAINNPSEDSAVSSAASVAAVPAPGFYPADLTYHGGAVVKSANSNNVYVNRPASHWGNPAKFLADLQKSAFVHTIDQYIGTTANNRYGVGLSSSISYPIFEPLGNNDLVRIVHAAAAAHGGGYGHIYHVFLPKGVDFCDPTGACYSPDNLSTFFFCAFHGSVQFTDIGHVLFSLEPYQNVPGCGTAQPSPNGPVVDATDSVLSHELIETITDPDGTGWWAQNSLATLGEEIADLCPVPDLASAFFKNPVSTLNGKPYEIQFEYSNKYHACANVK
jgi:hypothetical protein